MQMKNLQKLLNDHEMYLYVTDIYFFNFWYIHIGMCM